VMQICRREDPAEVAFGRRTVSCHLHSNRDELVAPPQATNPIVVSHRMS
jgi:hypothetical protein